MDHRARKRIREAKSRARPGTVALPCYGFEIKCHTFSVLWALNLLLETVLVNIILRIHIAADQLMTYIDA